MDCSAYFANNRTDKRLSALSISTDGAAILLAHKDYAVVVNMALHGLVNVLLRSDIDWFRTEWTLRYYSVVLGWVI